MHTNTLKLMTVVLFVSAAAVGQTPHFKADYYDDYPPRENYVPEEETADAELFVLQNTDSMAVVQFLVFDTGNRVLGVFNRDLVLLDTVMLTENDVAGFPSTDPMWMKYPSTSPYAYVGNNPIMRTDPSGMDFDPESEKIAQNLESSIQAKQTALGKQISIALQNGQDAGELSAQYNALLNAAISISAMRNDHTTEYRYENAINNGWVPQIVSTETNDKGQRIIIMYNTGEGSQIHEGIHGGQIAMGEFNLVGKTPSAEFNLGHEVSATRAQVAYGGYLDYFEVSAENISKAQNGMIFPRSTVNRVSDVTHSMVRSIGELDGRKLSPLYEDVPDRQIPPSWILTR